MLYYPCTDERAAEINKANGNSSDDLFNALICTSSGWDIPAALEIISRRAGITGDEGMIRWPNFLDRHCERRSP